MLSRHDGARHVQIGGQSVDADAAMTCISDVLAPPREIAAHLTSRGADP